LRVVFDQHSSRAARIGGAVTTPWAVAIVATPTTSAFDAAAEAACATALIAPSPDYGRQLS